MKRLTVLYFLLHFLLQAGGQQSLVRGVVSIHNSETETGRRQYVANAEVKDEFGKAQSRITDNKGQFDLMYVGVADKATVSFGVKKQGLQVVNVDALSAVAGQQEVVRISMAAPEKVDEYKRKIYNVGKGEAEKRLEGLLQSKNKEVARLQKSEQQNTTRLKQLADEVTLLEAQRKRVEEQAQDLARRYAPLNLDDASPLLRSAFLLFQNGKLDSALLLLQRANLSGKVDSVLLEEKRIGQRKKELEAEKQKTEKEDSVKNQRKKDLTEALALKADMHKTNFQFDSAAQCFALLIRLDSLNATNLFNYAAFLKWLNQYDKAIFCFAKTLKLYREQTTDNPQTHEHHIAVAQSRLGALYSEKKEFAKAETALLEALQTFQHLAKSDTQTYEADLAAAQDNLGTLYSYKYKNEFAKAEAAFLEALRIRKSLAEADPQTYEVLVANTQNNLGALYGENKEFAKAEVALLEALEIRRRLVQVNPLTYEPDISMTQNNLGVLYLDKKEFAKAEAFILESLAIRKRLALTNPQTYEPFVARTQNNLGSLYRDKHEFAKAEELLVQSFLWREKLMNQYPGVYSAATVLTASNLLDLYTAVQDSFSTEVQKAVLPSAWKTVDDKLFNLAKSNKDVAQKYANYCGSHAWYALFAFRFKEAENAALRAFAADTTQVWIKTNLAHSLLFQNRYEEAIKVYGQLKPLKTEEGESYAIACLADLNVLEKAGISHKDFGRIRVFLKNNDVLDPNR